jgi:RnfABCDGE-type electron transport complex D subunit
VKNIKRLCLESGDIVTETKQAVLSTLPKPKDLSILTGALLALLIAATVIFGWYVLLIAAISVITALGFEYLFIRFRKQSWNHSLFVTPLIFALMLPPTAPWWLVIIGSAFAILFGKAIFGGFGKNVFNPAAVGYLFVLISFPVQMATSWIKPGSTDIMAGGTPLILLNNGQTPYSLWELLVGYVPGTLGETFRLGIIILGVILIVLKTVDWRIPLTMIASVFIFTFLGRLVAPTNFHDPIYAIFVGGLMFAAFFVASDPVTAPVEKRGRIYYGIGLGLITVIIRNLAAFPEGIVFAVIIMNAISPLIDASIVERKAKKEALA